MSTKSTIMQLRRGTLAELKELNTHNLVNENEIMNVTDTNELYIGKAGNYEKITKGGVFWSSAKDYLKGDIVVFQEDPTKNMFVYYAAQDNSGELPHDTGSGSIVYNKSNWLSVNSEAEVGGIIWKTGWTYKVGDIVYNPIDLSTYVCTSGHTSTASLEQTSFKKVEKGGVIYEMNQAYVVGDMVTESDIAYTCITVTGPGAFAPADWVAIGPSEKGGVIWDATLDYKVGDLVSYDNTTTLDLYVAIGVPALGGIPGIDSNWKLFDINMLVPAGTSAGDRIVWDATGGIWIVVSKDDATYGLALEDITDIDVSTNPATGDILVYNDITPGWENQAKIIQATQAEVDSGGTLDAYVTPETLDKASQWDRIRGKVWNNLLTYDIGDIVSLGANDLYVSQESSNVGTDPQGGYPWVRVDTIRYNAGIHDPTDTTDEDNLLYGSEYPDTKNGNPGINDEHVPGAVWYTTNVGDSSGSGFTFTDGPLIGITVFDNDKIVYQGHTGTDEIWLVEPFPKVIGEKGGIAFSGTTGYLVGDVASYNDTLTTNLYLCIQNTTGGATEIPTDTSFWEKLYTDKEIGRVLWDATNDYLVGDAVTGGLPDSNIYVCIQNTTVGSAEPVTDSSFWENKTSKIYSIDFDATIDQTDFIVSGVSLGKVKIFSNGVILRYDWDAPNAPTNEFTISDDGTDTTIVIKETLDEFTWVRIEYKK